MKQAPSKFHATMRDARGIGKQADELRPCPHQPGLRDVANILWISARASAQRWKPISSSTRSRSLGHGLANEPPHVSWQDAHIELRRSQEASSKDDLCPISGSLEGWHSELFARADTPLCYESASGRGYNHACGSLASQQLGYIRQRLKLTRV